MSTSPSGDSSPHVPPPGECTPEYRRECLPLVPLVELLPNRPRSAESELHDAMRLVSVALTESRFAPEAWLPSDPTQRAIQKPAWLAFAEEQRLSRNAAEWAVYRLAELGLIEVVWPKHEQLGRGNDWSGYAAEQAARYRGGRTPTVCDWDLFEDGRILTICSLPGLWDYARSIWHVAPAKASNGEAALSDTSDVAAAESVVIDYIRQAVVTNKATISFQALSDLLKGRDLERHLTAVILTLEARGVLIPGPSEPPTTIPRGKNRRALGVLIIQRGGPDWWRVGPGAVELLRPAGTAARIEAEPTHTRAGGGGLLTAIRDLGVALRTKVPYPERPGKHRIDLPDDRAEVIRAELWKAATGPIDALPPGVATRIGDLLSDLHNLTVRELEDPNGLHRRALDSTRDVESALTTPAARLAKTEVVPAAGAPFVPLTSWRDIFAALNQLHEPHAGKAAWKNDESTRDKIRKLNTEHDGPIKLPKGKGKQPAVEKASLLAWWAGLRDHFDARTAEADAASEAAHLTATDSHNYGASATVVPGVGGSVKRGRAGTGKNGKEPKG